MPQEGGGGPAIALAMTRPNRFTRRSSAPVVEVEAEGDAEGERRFVEGGCDGPEPAGVSGLQDASAAPPDTAPMPIGTWHVIDTVPRAAPVAAPDPDAPAWLPLVRTGGKDVSAPGSTFYDLQSERLKAALGKPPTVVSSLSATQELHSRGGGKGMGAS